MVNQSIMMLRNDDDELFWKVIMNGRMDGDFQCWRNI